MSEELTKLEICMNESLERFGEILSLRAKLAESIENEAALRKYVDWVSRFSEHQIRFDVTFKIKNGAKEVLSATKKAGL